MRTIITLFCTVMITVGCGKGGSGGDPAPTGGTGTTTPVVAAPGKTTLVFPAQNSVCNPGTVTSAAEASIVLNWTAGSNTDTYDIYIKNLLTNTTSTQTAATNQLNVTLFRGTPYAWYVVSKSNATSATATSDTWRFYMAGPGITSYSPFPAALTSPSFGQSLPAGATAVNLTWTGADADNDITGYDIYFGTLATPPLFKSNVTNMFLNNVSVSPKTGYYWKIVTRDAQGNTSDSGIFQFSVN